MKKLFVILFLLTAAIAFSQQKYALVIGNGAYTGIPRLNNPVNDANDVAAVLQGLGFTVDKLLDANLIQMESAIQRFKSRLSVSRNAYGFFFYAGHGVQSGGVNYLIPVNATIPTENYLRERAFSFQMAMSELNEAENALNIFVLDACRDNPFSWRRSNSRGLDVVREQPVDSIVMYAAASGQTASDGTGRNGLFTTHLLNNLKIPGLELKEVFNRTGADVSRASNREQIPAIYSHFFGTAYLGSGLTVWSFTDELANMINNYYRPSHPDIIIEYSQTPWDQFHDKLDPVLASGQSIPDVITLESAFVRKYVESGLLMDLTAIYERNKSKLLAFPVEIGTYNGRVYAMSWQACPGAMFYRRSIARKYLGTDDPARVQAYFSDRNKLLETAKLLKEKSGGRCVLVASSRDLFIPFTYARNQPWIVNGKLVIDPVMEEMMDVFKALHDYGLEGRVGQWSEGWFAGMKGELRDKNNNMLEVFSYFLPTWGLHYVLKTNAPNTSGDWAMIQGPVSWRWGGTWLGVNKNSRYPETALAMIEYLTTNDSFLEQWAKDTGDLVSNTNVINRIRNGYSESYLAGQNQYAAFADMAKNVNSKLLQATDEAIENLFYGALYAYIDGEKTKNQALAEFRLQAQSYYESTLKQ
jgi:ABC-type glycerol-3-phosphate transport system substrate-binding protein